MIIAVSARGYGCDGTTTEGRLFPITLLPVAINIQGMVCPDIDVEDTISETDYFHFVTRRDIGALKWGHYGMRRRRHLTGLLVCRTLRAFGSKLCGEAWIGPYIYDGKGDLTWSGAPLFDNFNIFDFRPIEICGENMLTANRTCFIILETGMVLIDYYDNDRYAAEAFHCTIFPAVTKRLGSNFS